MYRISRRQFFQFAGSTLATIGLSQLDIQQQAERYGKVLAQSTPRKLALLVGINQYSLFLLMSAVKSENFTAVLDSCYSGAATRKFRVRARDGGNKVQISPEEKSYQDKWLSRLNLSREEFVKRYQAGVAKGVVLAATNPNQTAADAPVKWFLCRSFYLQFDAVSLAANEYAGECDRS
jgi:hypothetical protein